jgi:hypothetical protein
LANENWQERDFFWGYSQLFLKKFFGQGRQEGGRQILPQMRKQGRYSRKPGEQN